MFKAIPFLAIIVIAYNVIAYNVIALLTGPALSSTVMSATLPSGAAWTLTLGDLLILAGISLLFLEIVKASRSRRAGVDHALSIVLFVVAVLRAGRAEMLSQLPDTGFKPSLFFRFALNARISFLPVPEHGRQPLGTSQGRSSVP
jgi:hypothetical protein